MVGSFLFLNFASLLTSNLKTVKSRLKLYLDLRFWE